jgi:hypothetical protein
MPIMANRTRTFGSLVAAALAAGVAACQPPPADSGSSNDRVGSIAFALTLGGGYRLAQVSYDISGNGFHKAADVDVSNSATFSTLVSGIPFGTGYTLKLTARDADHKLESCLGTATFDVASASTVTVPVHVACKVAKAPAPPPPPMVPVPRWATLALGLLLASLGARRAARRITGVLAIVGLSLAGAGCDGGTPSNPSAVEDVGVKVSLVVAPGTTLSSVNIQVTGPGSFMKTTSLDVGGSSTISTVLAPIPPGNNYQITLASTSVEGDSRCTGSASFDVASRATTNVLVHLLCQKMTQNGLVSVTSALNACPLIDDLGAIPGEVVVGGSLALTSTAHDLDGGPAPLTRLWAAPSGTFTDATAASPTFTCTASGAVPLTLTVSDGDSSPGCPDTETLTVVCTGVGP